MVDYGFRLYKVGLREAAGNKAMPWEGSNWSYLSRVRDGLKEIYEAQRPSNAGVRPAPLSLWYSRRDLCDLTELPLSPMTASSNSERRVGRLVSVDLPARHRLSIEIRTGYVGAFEASIGLTADRSMENEAAAHDYRAELVVPEDDSDGLLAVEAIGRSCPVQPLTCLLGLASRQDGWTNPPADGRPATWWGLSTEQATDPAYFQDLLEADAAELHLQRTKPDGQGKRERVDRLVVAKLTDRDDLERARNWIRLPKSARQNLGVRGLIDIVDADEKALHELDMTGGYIRAERNGVATKIRIDDELERFTYRIQTTHRPAPEVWRERVHARMSVVDDTLIFT